MSKATKRKHVTREILDEYILPEGDQEIVKVGYFPNPPYILIMLIPYRCFALLQLLTEKLKSVMQHQYFV